MSIYRPKNMQVVLLPILYTLYKRNKMKMQTRIALDYNGNSIVRLTFSSHCGKAAKGFSIQTNGNLPNTHRTRKPDNVEILEWVKRYGTLRQKAIVGNLID